MRNIPGLTVVSMVLLAACGADSPGEADNASGSAPVVRVEVGGAVSSTLEKPGSLFCTAADLGPGYSFELYVMTPPESFNLVFSRSLTAGEHAIAGSDDRAADADALVYYRSADRIRFDKLESGTFVINTIPTQSGETFSAELVAELRDDDGAMINLSAAMEVTAGSSTFAECP